VAAPEERPLLSPDVTYIGSFTQNLRAYALAAEGVHDVPQSRAAMASRTAQDFVGSLASDDFSRLTIVVRVYDSRRGNFMYEDRLGEFAQEVRELAVQVVGAQMRLEVGGSSMAAVAVSRQLATDQITSSLISALLILLLTAVVLRSLRYGLFAIIPTAGGVLLTFLVMVALSIPLDMVTLMFSSVALGVGVDNSIHLVIGYRRRRELGGSDSEIIEDTLRVAGRPILHTLVSLVAGMAVLTFSGFVPIANFGILVSLAMICTTGTSLTVLPAILATELAGARKRAARTRP